MRRLRMLSGPAFVAIVLRALIAWLAFVVCASFASISYAEKRTALVIGNERYENISSAPKAGVDAAAVAEALRRLGFDSVMTNSNLRYSPMSRAIESFTSSVELNDLVVFYFAGNGVAINAQNFLLPIDVPAARAKEESRVIEEAFALGGVIARLQGRGARVVSIIDASRDNPFDRPGVQPLEAEVGLTRISQLPEMTYTFLSAGPNEKTRSRIDNKDPNPNSIFGRVLLSQLGETDVSVAELAINVQRKVRELAQSYNFHQSPIYYDRGIGASVYLSGRSGPRYSDHLKIRTKSDGTRRFRLSEIENFEDELPPKEECDNLGRKYGDQLRREGGESVRFWVRMQRGSIGYCQLLQNQWYVEYYDRDIQDALVLDFEK